MELSTIIVIFQILTGISFGLWKKDFWACLFTVSLLTLLILLGGVFLKFNSG